MTEMLEALDVETFQALRLETVEEIGTQFRIGRSGFQNLIDNHQDRMCNGDESTFLASPS